MSTVKPLFRLTLERRQKDERGASQAARTVYETYSDKSTNESLRDLPHMRVAAGDFFFFFSGSFLLLFGSLKVAMWLRIWFSPWRADATTAAADALHSLVL